MSETVQNAVSPPLPEGAYPGPELGPTREFEPFPPEAIERVKHAGMTPVMITGDNERTALAVATQVGVDIVLAEVLPGEKAAQIRQLQDGGTRVMMIGDGINDAPALTQADIGVAIGASTDIAIESADIVIMNDRLGSVMDAYQIGASSYRKTKQNLALAISFNGIGVAAAVTGLVSPVWAMIAMISSVTAVLANSFAGSFNGQLLRGRAPSRSYQSLGANGHHGGSGEPDASRDLEVDLAVETRLLDTLLDGRTVRSWSMLALAITVATLAVGAWLT